MDHKNIAASFNLPRYYSSTPSPDYSYELSSGERLLEYTPHQSSFTRPSSVYIRKEGGTTIILNDQEEGIAIPKYGRQGTISGTLCFEQNDNILEVTVKIQGTMNIFVSQGGAKSITVFEVSYPLWSQTSEEPQSPICPAQITFSSVLPATFKTDDDRTLSLPPTYSSPHLYLAAPQAKVSYELQVITKRTRHPKVAAWTKSRQISIPLHYVPRTRAHRPITLYSSFLSSIKIMPEEWYQVVAPLINKQGRTKLHSLLFMPSHRVYGLLDKIPFHVQLTGDTQALQELFPSMHDGVPSSSKFQTTPSNTTIMGPPRIEVVLLRQVAVSFKGSKSWEDTIIGEGVVWSTPPELTSKNEDICHIDWDGELRCKESITVGGFDAGNIHVKDFVVLKMIRTNPKCPVQALQITVPIRLVTDSFDVAGHHLNFTPI